VSKNLYYDLYCDRSIRNDFSVQNSRPDRFLLDRTITIKEAYLIDVAIPNCHIHYSTIIQKLQK